MQPSVSEIARFLGISKSTVSLVLNNRPHVSESMRKRVLEAIDVLQKEAPSTVQPLKKPLRFLLLHPAHMGSIQVFRELLQGIHKGIEEVQGRLTLAVHQPPLHPNHTTSVLLLDPSLRPDGVLLMGALREDPMIETLRQEHIPTVLVAREMAYPGFSAVGMDNASGARQATEYLIRLGHTRIAFLGGKEQYEYTRNRLAGYTEALKEAGLPFGNWVHLGTGEEAVKALLASDSSLPCPVTAILFVNDEHASQGLPLLQQRGLQIPEDLSVIAFDDTELASRWTPPLSSVFVPRIEIGELAVKSLVEQIRRPAVESIRILLKTTLNIRPTSIAPPRAKN
ncbi:MAG: LacI family DNA-binding transcriptional regulator [Spirochaetales bacterium]